MRQSEMFERPKHQDERWLEAYAEAIFIAGYYGSHTFELDGVVVTLLEPGADG